jgi:integrase
MRGHTDTNTLIASYINHQAVRGFSPATLRRRRFSLTQFAKAHTDVTAVTPDDVEDFIAHWTSPASRYAIRSDLNQFYKWACRRGHLPRNPVADVDAPRVPTRAATPLGAGELRRVLEVANRDQVIAVMLGAYAGLRCAEIAALDCADVHRGRGVLVVRNGKGGKDDIVPLAPELARVLPLRGPAVRYATGADVGRAIRRAYARAGVCARPHDTRHSFGTAVAQRSGGNMVLVAKLMRHASYQTSQRYVRWHPDGHDVVTGLHDDVA